MSVSPTKFIKLQTTNELLNRTQDNIVRSVNPLVANPLASYNILKSITLASGANSVPHGLDRPLQGWMIIRQRSSASVYDTQDANTTPSVTLQLTSSAKVVVDIYVF